MCSVRSGVDAPGIGSTTGDGRVVRDIKVGSLRAGGTIMQRCVFRIALAGHLMLFAP
jgi:hypothetical protein